MWDSRRSKIILAVVVAAAAIVAGQNPLADWRIGAILLLALANIVITAPGTVMVRLATLGIIVVHLLIPDAEARARLLILALLLWPPVFMLAAALGRMPPESDVAAGHGAPLERRARLVTAALIVTVASASLAFQSIGRVGLQQTAMLFVGLPALLAIGVVFFVRPRTAVGVACKAVTIGLAVSLLFLGEGVLCIVMSAPLFYGVAAFVGLAVRQARQGPRDPARTTMSCVALLALVPMIGEGMTERWSFPRDETVSVTRVLHVPASEIGAAVLQPPRLDRPLPGLLRYGFPRPEAARLDSGAGAERLVIRFRGGETRLNGTEPKAGDLTLELEVTGDGYARWRALADTSHMTHFLTWRAASVQWTAADADTTRVTWTLEYRRDLDPAWYFGPMERLAVRLAAGYLIDAVATP